MAQQQNNYIGTWLTDKNIIVHITELIDNANGVWWRGRDNKDNIYIFNEDGISTNGGKLIHKQRGEEDLRKRWSNEK